MKTMSDTEDLEQMIAHAIMPFIKELRMVPVADYVAFLRFEKHNQIADIVDSAAEQYFAPNFLAYRDRGGIEIDWGKSPKVVLALGFNTPSATFDFELCLDHAKASVCLIRVNERDSKCQSTNIGHALQRSIELNSVKS